jgi:hypothetical protein
MQTEFKHEMRDYHARTRVMRALYSVHMTLYRAWVRVARAWAGVCV